MDLLPFLGLFFAIVLVILNALFVAAEFSLVRVRKTRIDQLVKKKNTFATIAQRQLNKLDNYIAACQLGITLASLALGWIGEPAIANLIEPLLSMVFGEWALVSAHAIAIIISFTLITMLHIVFGELIPKSIALQLPEKTVLFIAYPLLIFNLIFRPAIHLLNSIGNLMVRLIGLNANNIETHVHSSEEIEMIITQSQNAGILDKEEEAILHRVFDFGEKDVKQIMTPRVEIIAFPHTAQITEILQTTQEMQYSRYPVYKGSLDSLIGFIHIKDLLINADFMKNQRDFSITKLIRPITAVPDGMSIGRLFSVMQKNQIHIISAIDEYGGTSGIVTMEDVLEEIMGDVSDEFDLPEDLALSEMRKVNENTWIISGFLPTFEFRNLFNIDKAMDEAETMGGFVMYHLDKLPEVGDRIETDRFCFEVLKMDKNRIERIRLTELDDQSNEL